jgi:hypothetical protein
MIRSDWNDPEGSRRYGTPWESKEIISPLLLITWHFRKLKSPKKEEKFLLLERGIVATAAIACFLSL